MYKCIICRKWLWSYMVLKLRQSYRGWVSYNSEIITSISLRLFLVKCHLLAPKLLEGLWSRASHVGYLYKSRLE